ncbi:lignin-forming anionic peroxidase-like [Aristolochia californica]|uniref:lignin-forming anionic peroxidase-like n=1 Tax=Aristolochia californica TaxID=171875 RepID=UPI0035DD58A7
MGLSPFGTSFVCFVITVMLVLSSMQCEAQLSATFYDKSCPKALFTIRAAIGKAVSSERRMAASLLRLHFHDCFVQGCDASVLLDATSAFTSEKNAPQNLDSVRGFDVIEDVKSQVEGICSGVVSCADILAVAARDASFAVGGPSWTVKLGRRDSTSANEDRAFADIPKFTDNLDVLIETFRRKDLSERDLVALSGAHTIGQAQCSSFRDRIYNATTIDASFASTRKDTCPSTGGDTNLAAIDVVTPNYFDNNFFKNLVQKKGLLQSDQVLFSGGSTDNIVTEYSNSPKTFFSDFAAAMVKMGDIEPLTGSAGQIRKVCSAVN